MGSANKTSPSCIQAKICRNSQIVWQKSFAISKYKTEDHAYRAAMRAMNKMEKEIPPTKPRRPKSNTGIKYISRCVMKRSRGKTAVQFSVISNMHGIRKAFFVGYEGDFTEDHEKKVLRKAKRFLKQSLAEFEERI